MLVASLLVAAACGEVNPQPAADEAPVAGPTVRILLVGDVMTGRGVAAVMESDPDGVFAGVRHILAAPDFVGANLESPLTDAPHVSANENELEADPATADELAAAGFDLLSLTNNHSTDAGAPGVIDTLDAVEAAGMMAVGAGTDGAAASAPVILAGEITIGFLAYDATGVGVPAGDGPGVATWDENQAIEAVGELRPRVDVLVVSLHGGTEYLPVPDPGMLEIGEILGSAGADVVWGHGAHVVQPVRLLPSTSVVVATSLGNFLFDQAGPDRTRGAVLEVLAGGEGVRAYRVGIAEHPARRVEFVEWLLPEGDAVWLDDGWWSLVGDVATQPPPPVDIGAFRYGDVNAVGEGDVTGDGNTDVVVAFRRPHQQTPLMELRPDVQWADAAGRSAHVGLYEPDGLREIWVAGTVVMPVADLTVCNGAIATVHDQLDDPDLVAGGAWEWNGFGFETAPDIPGPGTPGCADIDGDGATEPVILGRN